MQPSKSPLSQINTSKTHSAPSQPAPVGSQSSQQDSRTINQQGSSACQQPYMSQQNFPSSSDTIGLGIIDLFHQQQALLTPPDTAVSSASASKLFTSWPRASGGSEVAGPSRGQAHVPVRPAPQPASMSIQSLLRSPMPERSDSSKRARGETSAVVLPPQLTIPQVPVFDGPVQKAEALVEKLMPGFRHDDVYRQELVTALARYQPHEQEEKAALLGSICTYASLDDQNRPHINSAMVYQFVTSFNAEVLVDALTATVRDWLVASPSIETRLADARMFIERRRITAKRLSRQVP